MMEPKDDAGYADRSFTQWDSSRTAAGEIIESVTHVVVAANRLLAEIHNTKQRMPAILEKADREAWLIGMPDEAWETLTPYPDDLMVAWPVSTRVDTPKNNDFLAAASRRLNSFSSESSASF